MSEDRPTLEVEEREDGTFDVVRRDGGEDQVVANHPLRSGAEADAVRLTEAAERGELGDAGLDAEEVRPDNAAG